MKNKWLPLLLLTALVIASMSTSWSQAVTPKAAQVVKPVVPKEAAPTDAQPLQVAPASKMDRRNKAVETVSNMQKKSEETSKSVTGNLK
jgi:hypothetical protein